MITTEFEQSLLNLSSVDKARIIHLLAESMKRKDVGIKSPRPFGLAEGEFTVPDDFDAPLPEDILLLFEGK